MQTEFWLERWRNNEIGFHEHDPNPMLVDHLDQLQLVTKARIFVPLCGKSVDMAWLVSLGFEVVGVELAQSAVDQFFSELKIMPTVSKIAEFKQYKSTNLTIFVGDVFELSRSLLGKVDAIYDRGALVALPETMRRRYAQHTVTVSEGAKQLIVTFDYDQSKMQGPPFSVTGEDMPTLYGTDYKLKCLRCEPVANGLKGLKEVNECAWLLST